MALEIIMHVEMIILDLGFKAEFSFLFFFNFYSRVKHHLSCLRSSDMAIV